MTGWEAWVIGISIGVVALAFVVLVIFLALALQSLRHTLRKTDKLLKESKELVQDVEKKLHAFDPYVNVVKGVGSTIERHACEDCDKVESTTNTAMDVLEWGVLGFQLWERFRDKRR